MAPEMTWTRIMGVAAGLLAVLAYGHVLSVRVAVMIFLAFASCLVFLVFICDEGNNCAGRAPYYSRTQIVHRFSGIHPWRTSDYCAKAEIAQYLNVKKGRKFSYQGRGVLSSLLKLLPQTADS